MIVRDFGPYATQVPGLELAAIVGRPSAQDKLDALAAELAIPLVFTDYDACLASDAVDTVWVALPNSLHYEYSKRALLAGKHVICEKPFVLNASELAELTAVAQERDLILVEAISNQHSANYLAIKERMGEVGSLRLVQCDYSQFSSRYARFRAGEHIPAFDPTMGGGALLDLGIYTLHFVAGLLGRPRSVTYTPTMDNGVDTSGVVVMDYGNVTAVCVCAKDSGGPIRSKLQGDAATIFMDGAPNAMPGFSVQPHGGEAQAFNLSAASHRMIEEFVEFERLIAEHDTEARDRYLAHSALVLDIALEALASAGISLGE